MIIAHLSDTHVGGAGDPSARVRAVLAHLAAMQPQPDVVLVTGDIVDNGRASEYDEAARVLGEWRGAAPMLLCPGNHDGRPGYAALRGLPEDRPLNEAHRVGGVLFCMLDSLVSRPDGRRVDEGYLEPATLVWLDAQLSDRPPGERAVVCLHHPPRTVGIRLMDPIRLTNGDALADVLQRHPGIVAVLVGHAHTACVTSYAGLPLLIPGGVATTVTLDQEDLPVITDTLPPVFAVHLLDGDDLVTHWRAVV